MATRPLLLLLAMAAVAILALSAEAHNITAILEGSPDYSLFNSYLTQTKVADEINSRETVTCLALPNSAMSSLVAKKSLAGIKNALRLLVLLDYFDPAKLHDLPDGTTLSTTLYQTTGNAPGNSGFVNITDRRGGDVLFGPSAKNSALTSRYTKSVRQIPYNISVIEISAPIVFPGLLDAPSAATSNITALLEKAGCKTFAGLLQSSGVLKVFETAMDKGLTLFAPNDEAFKASGAPDLSSITSAELVTLLQYHALPTYTPKASLKSSTRPVATMASGASGKFDLSVESAGDDVTLKTGVDTSRVASTVLDDTPVCILTVDNLLLPVELFGAGPAPAPGPAALTPAEAPGPAVAEPVSAPVSAKAPAPEALSPPAPPMGSPEGSPAEAPGAADVKASDKAGASAGIRPVGLVTAALAAVCLL
ncbi:putative fasciclin-like arabinogalactan protein 8 [Iris pallida]|uniref:Fasciclin-like arabinogalactan protein 8 n=1 Tax=Iris pallida TaxID=29817 RepID=A0AAX6HID3_IRIPA|nr:putative fasciclin-like arabinogalactan protein 8 [Iris pallida]